MPRSLPKLQTDRRKKRLKLALISTCCVLLTLAMLALGLFINLKFYFCAGSLEFVAIAAVCDGKDDCMDGEDELKCVSNLKTNSAYPVRLVSKRLILQVSDENHKWSSVCAENWNTWHTPHASQPPVWHPLPTVPSATHFVPLVKALEKDCSRTVYVCVDCGEVVSEDRVIGGAETAVELWPWQASVQWYRQHVCGGALISTRWVISAAHCFAGRTQELGAWRVVLGQTYMTSYGGISMEAIIIHGHYDPVGHDYDVSIFLFLPIASIHPVCLPPYQLSIKEGEELVVTGWGTLRENGELSSVLEKATVPLIGWSKCSNSSIYGSALTPRMLCAGYLKGGVDSCQGDSGGPLVYLGSRWQLVGVVSWGTGCARRGKPGVYTNISQLLDWIYAMMEVSVHVMIVGG
uniref:Peptidase S1 domain-containing protein n=1 Tax=Electrophorus electricus TaxID=8005 RepID=A0A4W4GLK5_ELEEL